MPYKDREAKRRYMALYYEQKIKTGEIPCTVHRKRSYGLNSAQTNKTSAQTPSKLAVLTADGLRVAPNTQVRASFSQIMRHQSDPTREQFNPFRTVKSERQTPALAVQTGGAEYRTQSQRIYKSGKRRMREPPNTSVALDPAEPDS
jgi:hypothetical protein